MDNNSKIFNYSNNFLTVSSKCDYNHHNNLFKTPPSTSKNRDRRISQLEESPIVESISSNNDSQSLEVIREEPEGSCFKFTKSKARECTPLLSPPEHL